MAALLPFAIPGILGLLSSIPSIVSLARGKGGKLRRVRRVRRHARKGGMIKRHKRYLRVKHHKGRGVIADVVGGIPLIGSLLGPLIKSFGGKITQRQKINLMKMLIKRKGRGLVNQNTKRPFALVSRMRGRGLVNQTTKRPFALTSRIRMGGLLSPAGGKIVIRRGHYRQLPHRRIRVRGSGMLLHPTRSMRGIPLSAEDAKLIGRTVFPKSIPTNLVDKFIQKVDPNYNIFMKGNGMLLSRRGGKIHHRRLHKRRHNRIGRGYPYRF